MDLCTELLSLIASPENFSSSKIMRRAVRRKPVHFPDGVPDLGPRQDVRRDNDSNNSNYRIYFAIC